MFGSRVGFPAELKLFSSLQAFTHALLSHVTLASARLSCLTLAIELLAVSIMHASFCMLVRELLSTLKCVKIFPFEI